MANPGGMLTRNSIAEQQIEEKVTCVICGNMFNDPRTIPCLHTFCKCCLEERMQVDKKTEASFCCPVCGVTLPQDKMASIPTNFVIESLVEIVRRKKEHNMDCDNCLHRNTKAGDFTKVDITTVDFVAPAEYWCAHCAKFLCEKCHEAHKQWSEFAEHKCIAIKQGLQKLKVEMCKHHTTKPLDFYCKDCRCLICFYCTKKDHKDHEYEDNITKVADEERERVKDAAAPLDKLLEQVRSATTELQEIKSQIDVEGEANVQKIRSTFAEVHKLLKRQEEEAIDKANSIKQSCEKRLALQIKNVKHLEAELVFCDEFRRDILGNNRTRKLIAKSDWIKTKSLQLKTQMENSKFNPECTENDLITKQQKPIDFMNNLGFENFDIPYMSNCSFSRYGQIVKPTDQDRLESPNPYPTMRKGTLTRSQSTLVKESTKTDQVKIIVTLSDAFGFPVDNQSSHLEICCKDGLQTTRIREWSSGQYFISYIPLVRKNHLLQIYWKGHLVNHEHIKVLMTVRDYNNVGQVVKTIEKYGSNNEQLIEPDYLAKGPNNELIVCDHSTKHLVVFDKQFQYSHVIGEAGRGNGKFQRVTGIAVDRKGFLYVADCTLHCIQKFKFSGEFVSQFSSEDSSSPFGMVVSQSEQLFVCDSSNDRIQVFQYEKFVYGFGQHGTEPGSFNQPQDLALNNSEDQLFVTDNRNDRVQVFTPKGQFLKIFDRFANVVFSLKSPFGINYTPDGYLLVSTQNSNCVLVLRDDGEYVRAIENKKRFSDPRGVLVMDDGQIVIADKCNNRLLVF